MILIVEDDTNLLAALKYNLDKDGYDVITSVDGAEAVEIARKVKPDLIILKCYVARNERVLGMPHFTQGNDSPRYDAAGED